MYWYVHACMMYVHACIMYVHACIMYIVSMLVPHGLPCLMWNAMIITFVTKKPIRMCIIIIKMASYNYLLLSLGY